MKPYRFPIPASFFGMVLGTVGIGNIWRLAAQVWMTPSWIGESIMALAAALWTVLIVLYAGKWLYARDAAIAEAAHPVQAGFVSLVPLTTMLMALVALPYERNVATAFWLSGVLGQLAFGVYYMGGVWKGGRDAQASTTSMYLPTVGVNLVAATVAGALGYAQWGALFFGAGVFSWLSLESVILHRHAVLAPLPLMLRASLGIQLAPPVVGAMAYLSITTGPPDLFARSLLGYGLFQALLLLRMARWFLQQEVGASAWAFTFGITALAAVPMRMLERGGTWPETLLVWPLFLFANAFVGLLAVATLRLLFQARLLPKNQVNPANPVSAVNAVPPALH
jgi:tellurite resistance protein